MKNRIMRHTTGADIARLCRLSTIRSRSAISSCSMFSGARSTRRTPEGQFVDRGHAYTSAIFYYDEDQRRSAEISKSDLASSGRFDKPIVTPVVAAPEFFPAEEEHQDFYKRGLEYEFTVPAPGATNFWPRPGEPRAALSLSIRKI